MMAQGQKLSLVFEGARVLQADGLQSGPLGLEGALIASPDSAAPEARAIDARGYLILPGIVDLHGDGFEHHLAPRRGAQSDPRLGLAASEAELVANGITTAWLAQFYSWEGGMRGPDFAETLADALAHYSGSGVDLRMQLRFEVGLAADPEHLSRAQSLIASAGVGYVVFNDHLPHMALAAGKRPPRLTGQALKSGRSPEAHLALLQELHKTRDAARAALRGWAADLGRSGCRMGSHDDPDPEARRAARALGASICEFPETRAAAEAAIAAGEPVIMGAPNVVRGGSHDGKVSARDLIADGLVTALVSDYHYPAPLRAALALWRDGMDLQNAWGFVSAGPCAIMGLQDRGRIAPGLRADLIFLRDDGSDRIDGVMAGGRILHLGGPLACRIVAGTGP